MRISLFKKINSLYIGADITFSLKLFVQPHLYEISSDFGKETKEIDSAIKKFKKVMEKILIVKTYFIITQILMIY